MGKNLEFYNKRPLIFIKFGRLTEQFIFVDVLKLMLVHAASPSCPPDGQQTYDGKFS